MFYLLVSVSIICGLVSIMAGIGWLNARAVGSYKDARIAGWASFNLLWIGIAVGFVAWIIKNGL